MRSRDPAFTDIVAAMVAAINADRYEFAIGVIGGATTVIDYGGVRFVSDPTFDPPGPFGPYSKVEGPAVQPEQLGPVDVVLLSHDLHMDNFDYAGRAFAAAAALLLTGGQAAGRLGGNAHGLAPYESTVIEPTNGAAAVTVFAVPAQHGPSDGERDEYGNINTEVTGFVLRSPELPTVYLSGDNASLAPVMQIGTRFPDISVGVLHIGAARVPAKFSGRPLTLTSDRASDVAVTLGLSDVIPAHCRGWSLYSEGPETIRKSFADAGIGHCLRSGEPGVWSYIGGPDRDRYTPTDARGSV
jgi:L-ascorbate metabolism protein UlaG (beta-lactamase superfamily)